MANPVSEHPSIHIVDDDDGFRTGYAMNLAAEGLPLKPYADAESFLAQPLWPCRGVVSLDIDFAPGRLNGLAVFERLLAERSSMPVIFLTGPHDKDVRLAVSLVTRREDVEFFPKHPVGSSAVASDAALLATLRRFLSLEPTLWAQAEEDRAVLQCVLNDLTPAERQVLSLLVADRGMKSFAMACELGKKEGVVELQRLSGQRKLLGEGRSRPSVAERVGPALQRAGVRSLGDLARHELLRRLALLDETEAHATRLLAAHCSRTQVLRSLGWPMDPPALEASRMRLDTLLRRAWHLLQARGESQLRRWFLSTLGHVPAPGAPLDGRAPSNE